MRRFDDRRGCPYTLGVHRLIASVVVSALLSIAGSSALQHVHAYGDHDHVEHHHGPAAHAHVAVHHHDTHSPTSSAIEGCEPGAHALSVVFTYVGPQPDDTLAPTLAEVLAFAHALEPLRAIPLADLRTHSPPRITDAPLRAPPPVTPA